MRDHLVLGHGQKAHGDMVRKERAPASGSKKNHFGEREEEEEDRESCERLSFHRAGLEADKTLKLSFHPLHKLGQRPPIAK